MNNELDFPIKIISVYLLLSSLSLLFSIFASFDILGTTPSLLFLGISVLYFMSGVLIFKKNKAGFYLLFISLFFTIISIKSSLFSFNYSTVFDMLIYYSIGGEIGIDSYLGGRVALVWNDVNVESTRVSIDLVALIITFFTARYYFNTYK